MEEAAAAAEKAGPKEIGDIDTDDEKDEEQEYELWKTREMNRIRWAPAVGSAQSAAWRWAASWRLRRTQDTAVAVRGVQPCCLFVPGTCRPAACMLSCSLHCLAGAGCATAAPTHPAAGSATHA